MCVLKYVNVRDLCMCVLKYISVRDCMNNASEHVRKHQYENENVPLNSTFLSSSNERALALWFKNCTEDEEGDNGATVSADEWKGGESNTVVAAPFAERREGNWREEEEEERGWVALEGEEGGRWGREDEEGRRRKPVSTGAESANVSK